MTARATASGVTTVIPMYNNAAHVADAIASVLAQTQSVLEVLVVDDGSTDDSIAIAERFGGPVEVVQQEHAGQGAARNAGIRRARGDLVAFLDADDLWLPEKLALQTAMLAAGGCEMVFGRVEQFFSPELEQAGAPTPLGGGEQRGVIPSALLLRTEEFGRVGEFREDVTFGDFVDWYGRARDEGLRARTVDHVVVRRRIHADNTGVRDRDGRREYARVIKDLLDRRAAADPMRSAR